MSTSGIAMVSMLPPRTGQRTSATDTVYHHHHHMIPSPIYFP